MDIQVFKNAMAHFASGVTVVSSKNEKNKLFALTVSSFVSVSLNPTIISICLDNNLEILKAIKSSKVFCVNILSYKQQTIGHHFAERSTQEQDNQLENIDYKLSSSGVPLLSSCLAAIECSLHKTITMGDHNIVLGQVTNCQSLDNKDNPLLYYHRHWAKIAN